ncbi:unnamed protein product [Rotaria sp. Silwood2]|nr:unnamed protein product [Rotaria sp. Silwood2]CAF2832448.1 unnamed protein product [Rotaria sp. Silwood2]CAF4003990.1 unnamed protein product [Rotaria sp. Silwood2]CAF4183740.1 unnamed protein product [Rotaria sp. Silwood2]
MGGVLNRSSIEDNETYFRRRKDKRIQQYQNVDVSFESDYENNDRNVDLGKTYDLWDKIFAEQQMTKIDDRTDESNTYSSYNSITQNDARNQTRQLPHDVNNSLYSIKSHRMPPLHNAPYDPNEYVHVQVPDMINDQSQTVMFDERLSKKERFSSSSRQQQQKASAFKPLTNTQSLYESSVTANDISVTRKSVPLSNRSSVPRSLTAVPNKSSAQAPVKKAIYLTIDYTATLAERSQTVANESHHKHGERHHSDGSRSSKNNHRIRSHTNHQHKHQNSTDSSNYHIEITSSKSFDSLQAKSSGSQQTLLKSISINKLAQNIEKVPFSNNDTKQSKSRSNHRQQPLLNNQVKPSKSRENHQQHKRQHLPPLPNGSSLSIDSSIRRTDTKHSSSQMMGIPSSQNNHQHQTKSVITPVMTTRANASRAKV